ncbi:MAG: hypothetical protein QG616_1041 [Pseudomonadota bacterium]|nr:hypothetical protein [Pseudomonadota bacterium]MDQ5881211.1 hypothetical protein [Pseudomonadota bacterium]MDQ5947480.1 hypothetical protein [Pseudomonadota bacterium]
MNNEKNSFEIEQRDKTADESARSLRSYPRDAQYHQRCEMEVEGMSYFKRLWFAVATALSVSCVVADAGTCLAPKIDWRDYEWALITGNGKTACEEMLRYLKGRPKDRPLPVCPEDRLPTNGNWTRPAWQMLDDDQRQALLRDIPAEFADTPQAQELRKATVIKKARIDITRDGIPETLLAYGQGAARCERATHCAEAEN